MTTDGNAHEGKRTPILIVPGGTALPYPGNTPCLIPRLAMGKHSAHYPESLIQEDWKGVFAVGGIEIGSVVKAGTVVASGGDNFIRARADGILLDRRFSHNN